MLKYIDRLMNTTFIYNSILSILRTCDVSWHHRASKINVNYRLKQYQPDINLQSGRLLLRSSAAVLLMMLC